MPSAKYQMTFHMGSGEPGAEVANLLKRVTEKLGIKDETKCLRAALRALDKLPKDHPITKAAIAAEGQP